MATVSVTLYGIANCDTVKKARRWLKEQDVAYRFHDYHKAGIDEATLGRWIAACGWEQLLNRRGTTWRNLPQTIRHSIDEASATELMLERPAIIRRPVLDDGTQISVGFSPQSYATLIRKPCQRLLTSPAN